jgi:hypothetical protein
MTDKEVAFENELLDTFETILHLMEQIAVLDSLPEDLEQHDFVTSRALDVRSASMVYLAVCIRHHSTPGGIPGHPSPDKANESGKVLRSFFVGERITDAKAYLERCATAYDKAIANVVGVRLLTKVWQVVKGMLACNRGITFRDAHVERDIGDATI